MSNTIVHTEIGVTRLADGAKFYKLVFPHWKLVKSDAIPDHYFVEDTDNNDLSLGIYLTDEIKDHGSINIYIDVGDIPAAIQRITEAGGRVLMEKTAIGGENGYISRFEDPFGNHIGIWSKD